MHRWLHGYDVLRLGRMKGLGKGLGHPGTVFGHMTPRDVVEESNLTQAELELLMLLSVLGSRIRLNWISGELRGARYLQLVEEGSGTQIGGLLYRGSRGAQRPRG